MGCMVLFLSATVEGKMHDKKMADLMYHISEGFKLWQDTGYLGYKPKGVHICQPIKKRRGMELSDEEKEYNRLISQVRVRVEHAIGSIKRLRIVKDECRIRKTGFIDTILHTCAGLHNFRLARKPWKYPDYQPVAKLT